MNEPWNIEKGGRNTRHFSHYFSHVINKGLCSYISKWKGGGIHSFWEVVFTVTSCHGQVDLSNKGTYGPVMTAIANFFYAYDNIKQVGQILTYPL